MVCFHKDRSTLRDAEHDKRAANFFCGWKNNAFPENDRRVPCALQPLRKSSVRKRLDWNALRPCDALVESYLAEGAYLEAFNELVRGYQRLMVSLCRRQLGRAGHGGRAEEIAQEVFLTAYRILPQKGNAPVRPWLFAIARKRCWREWRDAERHHRLLEERQDTIVASVHPGNPISPEALRLSEAELERLRASLHKLKKWEREFLLKHFCEGYTIAMLTQEATFWSATTIRNRLNKALEHLRTIYKKLSEEV